jgi:hypothetical protein
MQPEDIKIGMKVIPKSSTFSVANRPYWVRVVAHEDLYNSGWRPIMDKGYIIVCNISQLETGEFMVECHRDGRKSCYGYKARYFAFNPEDLVLATPNEIFFVKEKMRKK